MQSVMMEDALPITAFGESAGKIFADIQKNGRRVIVDNDRPAFVVQTAEDYERTMDLLEDLRVEHIAAERLSKPRGKGTSFEDVLTEFGVMKTWPTSTTLSPPSTKAAIWRALPPA